MRKAAIKLQDLRRKIYIKAKVERNWRFWGLYVHICKMETLQAAYNMAKKNNGAPGIDGETFEHIERHGVENFLKQIEQELFQGTYLPTKNRIKSIPKANGAMRILGIPTIRDRVVQGALKLILEPIFEADFQEGSYGYRPNRTAHQAIQQVEIAVASGKTRVIDMDLKGFFDNMKHHIIMQKVAQRVNDPKIMRLLKLMLKMTGKKGVPQGGVISPLLANIYLNDVDMMLQNKQQNTRTGQYTNMTYARYADDIVILVDKFPRHNWMIGHVCERLKEELAKIQIELNTEKSKVVDLMQGESISFLGFDIRLIKSLRGKDKPHTTPKLKKRTQLLRKLKQQFEMNQTKPIKEVIKVLNPIVRGWVNYFRIGNSGKCFSYVRCWIEKKVRRHMAKTRKLQGYGWKKWSKGFLYKWLGLYNDYKIRHIPKEMKALL